MKTLFLDDNDARLRWARRTIPGVITVSTADQAIREFTYQGRIGVAYLDHDLGEQEFQPEHEENSGSGVVRWVVANRPDVGQFVVHSLNAPAANRMVSSLKAAGYEAAYIPFLRLIEVVT